MAAKSGELQPLDFSLVKDNIRDAGAYTGLKSDILDALVFLLQSADEENRIIYDTVEKITKLYLRAQPLDSDEDSDSDSYDPKAYDAELFFWMLWGLLLVIVRMIPYNHPKQELLVKFLKTLYMERK
jgi:hypothetical protein